MLEAKKSLCCLMLKIKPTHKVVPVGEILMLCLKTTLLPSSKQHLQEAKNSGPLFQCCLLKIESHVMQYRAIKYSKRRSDIWTRSNEDQLSCCSLSGPIKYLFIVFIFFAQFFFQIENRYLAPLLNEIVCWTNK